MVFEIGSSLIFSLIVYGFLMSKILKAFAIIVILLNMGNGCDDLIDISTSRIVLYNSGTTSGGNLGGRSGADSTCQSSKPSNVGEANVRAFISVSATDEIRDMPLNYGVPTNIPVASPSGILVDTDFNALLDGSIRVALAVAGVITNSTRWFSGSQSDGSVAAANCTGFTSSGVFVFSTGGDPDVTDSGWINFTTASCASTINLLCIAF